MAEQGNKPIKEFRAGTVRAAIWKEDRQDAGRQTVRFSVRIEKRYYDEGSKEWRNTDILREVIGVPPPPLRRGKEPLAPCRQAVGFQELQQSRTDRNYTVAFRLGLPRFPIYRLGPDPDEPLLEVNVFPRS